MHGLLSLWRRDDTRGSPSATKEHGRRIDKAAIGVPVLLSLPRRFEIYAGDHARGPLTCSSSQRSGTHSLTPGAFFPPPPRHPPPARDASASPYPLIRSYSLPTLVCPPLSTPSGSAGLFASPAAARANSCSPLHDIRRPLSPILEQCASPASLKPASPLPESEISVLELPRPVERPQLFIQRTLSKSQTPSIDAPSIPALNFAPPFPGPHPSQDGDGPPRRPPRVLTMPAPASVYSTGPANSSTGSLHAESFVTASGSLHIPVTAPSINEENAHPISSATSSILPISSHDGHVARRGTLGSGGSLRRKRQRLAFATPAFCAFWLGFLFPPLWWVGGWYFTFFAEAPAQRSLFAHYVLDTRWGAALCLCGRRRASSSSSSSSAPPKPLLLPRWVGTTDPAAALQGISYYYPFVSRPPGHRAPGPPPRLHRLFDDLTRSRLARVRLARESPRRMIDPWIERCRRALCYWCLVVLLFTLGMIGWSFAVGAGKARY
ncbi:hypothetical protein B0H17DRAFT_1126690 [Mycena rosella]|uniref:Transmembrane protein n=1 Tax=Mycena rosella TaxID=1033263 RepID=A0AAD7GSF7_MYCRO|nr:hypothetical protein B0H17DRAFT_1126690 [Mycena rosella]